MKVIDCAVFNLKGVGTLKQKIRKRMVRVRHNIGF